MQLTINIVYHSLLYGAEDPSIAGMVLDSPFSDLVDLMMELVDTYKIRLPKFTVCKSIAPKYIYQLLNCWITGLHLFYFDYENSLCQTKISYNAFYY